MEKNTIFNERPVPPGTLSSVDEAAPLLDEGSVVAETGAAAVEEPAAAAPEVLQAARQAASFSNLFSLPAQILINRYRIIFFPYARSFNFTISSCR